MKMLILYIDIRTKQSAIRSAGDKTAGGYLIKRKGEI